MDPHLAPPTPEMVEVIKKVVASRLPASDDGSISPPAPPHIAEEVFMIYLALRMGRMEDEDRALALLKVLVPRELWHYYNLFPSLAHWMERWIYGFTEPSLLDEVAPPGYARMLWAFAPLSKHFLERGYLYGLSLQPEVPAKHAEILRKLSYEEARELTLFKRRRWRLYALYTQTPFRLKGQPEVGEVKAPEML